MPSAKAIKARNIKYYKRNAESITSQSRDNYKKIPKNKKLPRVIILKRITVLTLRKQGQPLVSYIILIQSPKRKPLVRNIVLIQSPKRNPLVKNIELIQSPKRNPLVRNIVLIQSQKWKPVMSNIVLIQRR